MKDTAKIDETIGMIKPVAEVFSDIVKPIGKFCFQHFGPKENRRDLYLELMFDYEMLTNLGQHFRANKLFEEAQKLVEFKGEIAFPNTIMTVGKNDILDKHLAGSAYTAAWYIGLIGSASYTTGPAAGDTSASHGGWAENTDYSQATRPALAFSSAAAGVKTTSAASVFSMNPGSPVTIKGGFIISNNTKGGTTGILLSAGLATQGDQSFSNGDTINATYSLTLS